MLNKRTSDKSRISRFMPLCLYERYELAPLVLTEINLNWILASMFVLHGAIPKLSVPPAGRGAPPSNFCFFFLERIVIV